jgi:NADH dehydrogenase
MRVLVTGGTGVVGRPAVDHILEAGHRVRLLSRHAEEDARQWAEGVEPWKGSVADAEALRGAAEGCDAVLHVAGIEREDPPGATFERVNVEGTQLLLEECGRAGVGRFVFVSSLGAERGQSAYHRSKRAAEERVERFPGRWLIVRPGNVYGPGDQVISLMLQLVRMLPAVPVVGAGDQPFQPVWADDLGKALARAVEPDGPTGILEVAGREVTDMNGILEMLGEITGNRAARLPVPSLLAGLGTGALQALGVDFPLNTDQLVMLEEGNVLDPPSANALPGVFGVEPIPLREGLRRLADTAPELLPGDGVGPIQRQRYWADVTGSRYAPEELIRVLREEFSTLTPDGMLEVGTEPGTPTRLEEGATITMDIPLRGTVQVRVEQVEPESVTLVTLAGHHLAGVIRFSAREPETGRLRFEVTSFTGASSVVDAVAHRLVGWKVQKSTWEALVEAVVERSGGTAVDGVKHEEDELSEREAGRMHDWTREIVMKRRREASAAGGTE